MQLRSGRVYVYEITSTQPIQPIKEWPTVELIQERIKYITVDKVKYFLKNILYIINRRNTSAYENRCSMLCITELICKYPQLFYFNYEYINLLNILINKLEKEQVVPLPWDGYITKLKGLSFYQVINYTLK